MIEQDHPEPDGRRVAAPADPPRTDSGDDSDEGWSESAESTRDDDLRREVPPHHG